MNKAQSKQNSPEVRTRVQNKGIPTKLLLVAPVIGLAYGFGTFKPNHVVKKIQKEEDLKNGSIGKRIWFA